MAFLYPFQIPFSSHHFWPRYGLAAIFYFYLSMEDTSPGMPLSCIRWKRGNKGRFQRGGLMGFAPLRRVTWAVIKDKGLLTETEIKRVSDFPGTVPGALQTGWRMPSWWWWGERHGKKSFSLFFFLEEGDVFFLVKDLYIVRYYCFYA